MLARLESYDSLLFRRSSPSDFPQSRRIERHHFLLAATRRKKNPAMETCAGFFLIPDALVFSMPDSHHASGQ
jgi:hypothetical protein